MTERTLRPLAAAALLLAVSATAVSAGGWATITPDARNGQPTEGQETTIGFTVLQHGQTPAGWESPTLVVTDAATGERIEVKATGQGPDGHFVAALTLPRAGTWTWQVELRDLIVEATPQSLAVASADGTVPAMDAAGLVAAMERSRTELRAELRAEAGTEIEALRIEISSLGSQLTAARADAADLESQVAQLTAGGPPLAVAPGVPLIAVLIVGGLTGAVAGFGVAWLGRPTRRSQGLAGEEAAAGRLATR
jgi:hypothetical protein